MRGAHAAQGQDWRSAGSRTANIGITMEKKVETTVVYWGYIGIMQKMETIVVY